MKRLLILFLLASPAFAQTVQNPSFEAPVTFYATNGEGPWAYGVPSWTVSVPNGSGVWAPTFPGQDGKQIAWVSVGSISQDLGPSSSAYTLTVAVGKRSTSSTATISLGSCSQTVDMSAFAVNTLQDVTLTCQNPSELLIKLSATSGIFDNVRLAAVGPPPSPPQSVNLSISGNLSFDDGTPVTGSIAISQVIPTQTNNMLGQFTPDGQGNIVATISISTNFADICTFNFYLLDATGKQVGFMQQALPGATFQFVKSVTGFKVVLNKASCTISCTLGPGTTMGTLGQ